MRIRNECAPDREWERLDKMTEAELRQEYIDEGIDPDEVVESMRRLGRVMAARFADQIEFERRMPWEVLKVFPMLPEPVAAGAPAWTDGAAVMERASLMDLLALGDESDLFWARVKGCSMRDAGILDGDTVLASRTRRPKDGDLVVAHLADEGQVVKRLRLTGGGAILESANPDFAPIGVADAASLRICGVVLARAGSL